MPQESTSSADLGPGPIAPEPAKTPSLEETKTQLEIEKLTLEKEKLEQEISDAQRPYLFRNSQLLITVIATLGTVVGIGVGLREHYYEILVKNADFSKRVAEQSAKDAAAQNGIAQVNLAKANLVQRQADDLKASADQEAAIAKKAISDSQIKVAKEKQATSKAKTEASAANRDALARELVDASLSRLSDDPESSILLAMHAVGTTWSFDRSVLPEAESQLHNALLNSRVSITIHRPDKVTSVAWSPIGDRVATASEDGTVAISDATTSHEIYILKEHHGAVRTVAWSPDGKLLATGGDDQTTRIWQASTGHQLRVSPIRTGAVHGIAWSPDGKWIAIGSNQLKLWSSVGDESIDVDRRNDGNYILSVAWSHDGKNLAYGRTDHDTYIWSIDEKKLAKSWRCQDWVRAVAWSPDGKRLVTDNFFQATVWDVATKKGVLNFPDMPDYIYGAAWSPDGRTIAIGSDTTSIWDANTGKKLRTFDGHDDLISSVSWSPDGKRLLTGSEDHTAKIWNAAPVISEVSVSFEEGIIGSEYSLSWSPDGKKLAIAAGTLRARQADDGQEPVLMANSDESRYVKWSPDGKTLIVAGPRSDIRIVNAEDGRELRRFEHPDVNLSGMALNSAGTALYTAHSLGDIAVWNVLTGSVERRIPVEKQFFTEIEISPNGKYLLTVSMDAPQQRRDNGDPYLGQTVVWDSQTGRQLAKISDHAASAASWSPDSEQIVTAQGRVIKIWDWRTGNLRHTLVGHRKDVANVEWSPDGKQIASASGDLTTRIWNVSSGKQALLLGGHQKAVRRVAWSPLGDRLASIDIFGTTQIYATNLMELMGIARHRVTRPLSIDECRTYLHTDSCPPIPEF